MPTKTDIRHEGLNVKSFLFQRVQETLTFLYKYVQWIILWKPRIPTVTSTATIAIRAKASPPASFETTKARNLNSSPHTNALQYYKGKTIVLDLDETLVHSVRLGTMSSDTMRSATSASIKKKVIEVLNDKQSVLYEVYKRPHVDFFLSTVSQWYRVVIFTASMAEYADPVIDWLDQDQHYISQRYFRQSCLLKDGNFLKNISLAEPDSSKVCLVDNSIAAFELCQENAIPLPTWISNPEDECLLDLLPLLDALRFTADVRSILSLRNASSFMNI
ncbi:NLI interacting factor-like phosphatase-domain-containing protein [Mycotypha africana]|uniref:NLI interacting factor-like phosphatase-domain-containing protein n=1 Tax=Mycotypha africana TaxID=64632 RepID=UPI00230029A0|nr:NLI interacting factor-like phosphatase-domain-containing protein [Mycotypha africana]KAI8971695.1 NLI interacting factor-like phosphatase-domain-containing protein [Mycotypha africana]